MTPLLFVFCASLVLAWFIFFRVKDPDLDGLITRRVIEEWSRGRKIVWVKHECQRRPFRHVVGPHVFVEGGFIPYYSAPPGFQGPLCYWDGRKRAWMEAKHPDPLEILSWADL